MAQTFVTAVLGPVADDGNGNNLRLGGSKIVADLTELYARTPNATHSGDATGDTVLTLATVNGNVGTFTYPASITVNGKGLITAITAGVGGLINKYNDTVNLVAGVVTQKVTTATTHPYTVMITDSSDVDITSGLEIEYTIVGGFYALNIYSVDALNNCQIFILW